MCKRYDIGLLGPGEIVELRQNVGKQPFGKRRIHIARDHVEALAHKRSDVQQDRWPEPTMWKPFESLDTSICVRIARVSLLCENLEVLRVGRHGDVDHGKPTHQCVREAE